jgi:hypothetical protein
LIKSFIGNSHNAVMTQIYVARLDILENFRYLYYLNLRLKS